MRNGFAYSADRRLTARLLYSGVCALSLLAPAVAFAQTVPPQPQLQPSLPASIDPNRLGDQFKTPQLNGPPVEFEVPPPPPEATPPANADKVQFTLSAVTIDGATAIPASSFTGLYATRSARR